MKKSILIGVCCAVVLPSCVGLRERLAKRRGLQVQAQEQEKFLDQFYQAQSLPPAAEEQKKNDLTISTWFPELFEKEKGKREAVQNQARYYDLEKEAARLRWYAGLLRMEAKDLEQELVAADYDFSNLESALAQMKAQRETLGIKMAELDQKILNSVNRLKEIEMQRYQVVRGSGPAQADVP